MLLLLASVAQDGAHDVHLRVHGAAIAALFLDFLKDCRRCRQGKSGTAIFFGDQRGEIAGLAKRSDEFGRIFARLILGAPIFAGILRAKLGDLFADGGIILHRAYAFSKTAAMPWPPPMHMVSRP